MAHDVLVFPVFGDGTSSFLIDTNILVGCNSEENANFASLQNLKMELPFIAEQQLGCKRIPSLGTITYDKYLIKLQTA